MSGILPIGCLQIRFTHTVISRGDPIPDVDVKPAKGEVRPPDLMNAQAETFCVVNGASCRRSIAKTVRTPKRKNEKERKT